MNDSTNPDSPRETSRLIVQRVIYAPAPKLFAAWTQPDLLTQWWGPKNVTCPYAEVDLKVGGHYRIDNRMPTGETLTITGKYEHIDPPREIIFSWRLSPSQDGNEEVSERVTVRFEPLDSATQVTVIHERIPNSAIRDSHQQGWDACLDGLATHMR